MTTRRGTSNGNARGSSYNRAARRAYLLATYAANVQVIRYTQADGTVGDYHPQTPELQAAFVERLESASPLDWTADVESWVVLATCRCYRCGGLLTDETVTVDRILPGCKGGTYRRENIRPACGTCNSETGGALASRPRKAKA